MNLLPLPPGFTLITALPLLVTTAQMALGYPHVRLPRRLATLKIDHDKLRSTILRLRPITRRLENILRKRQTGIFQARNERILGIALFVISFALFLPLPLSGWFPAISLFVFGVGLVEQDGLIAAAGLAFGGFSVALTGVMIFVVGAGAEAMIN